MQNEFTEYVATITGLTPTQHKVLKVIAGFTDNNTGEAFPSLSTIAAGAEVARSTVQIAIDDLCEVGHLEFVRKRQTHRSFVNVYRVTIPTHTDGRIPTRTDSRTDPRHVPTHTDLADSSSNQPPMRTDSRTDTHTDRYRTDQVVSSGVSSPVKQETTNPNPISTDPLSPYVDRVVKRFARYKNPGRDAELYAREILLDVMFIGDKPEDHKTFLPAQEATIGDLAVRHLIDMIGWVFEINAYDQDKRAFRWAERTHTMKNLRDHILKEQSRLFAAYADWCVERQCGYSLGTVGEAEFVQYNEKIKQRIVRYKAAKAGASV